MSIQTMSKLVLKYLPVLTYTKIHVTEVFTTQLPPHLSQPKAFTKQ